MLIQGTSSDLQGKREFALEVTPMRDGKSWSLSQYWDISPDTEEGTLSQNQQILYLGDNKKFGNTKLVVESQLCDPRKSLGLGFHFFTREIHLLKSMISKVSASSKVLLGLERNTVVF